MASKYLQKFPIPEEFPDILMAFTREILRDQPADINEYGAMYFKAMHDVSTTTQIGEEDFEFQVYAMCNLLTFLFYFFRIHHSVIMLKGQEVLFHQIKIRCQTLQLTLRLCQARMHILSMTHLRESTNNIT